jgi:hypothetical protein
MEVSAAASAAAAEAAAARQDAAALGPLPGWRIEPFASSIQSSSSGSSSMIVPLALCSGVGVDVAKGGVEENGAGASIQLSSHEIPEGPQVEEPTALLRPSPAWLPDSYGSETARRRCSALSCASTASVGGGAFCESAAAVAGWLMARKGLSMGSEAGVGTSVGAAGFILYPAD